MKLTKAQILLLNKIINAKLTSKEVSEVRDFVEHIAAKKECCEEDED